MLRHWSIILFLISLPVFCQDSSPVRSHVPSWAKDAVWYQIFPERFRNGDTTNDPGLADIAGSWPHETPGEWHISPWASDWYKAQPWEQSDTNGFYHFVQRRRYGGDLQGIIDKLDYLAGLGINAIYINPVFESPSLHKYDASMYHHIDNNFGTEPATDRKFWSEENPADPSTWKWTPADVAFRRLVRDAHKRNIKVIIDGVFNHVGMTFWAFEDVRKNQQKSLFKDWFYITKWDDPSTPENEFDYRGWFGVRELPELREDGDNLAEGPRNHIKAVVKRWMDPDGDGNPSDGIDGWRLDVADMVPMGFWREFRSLVRSINPEAYLTGEVWWEEWKNDKMFNAAPWLQGDAFDAVMNYRWAREVCHFFIDKKNHITAEELDRRLAEIRNDYPADATYVLMNLLDSHDTDRLSSRIVNPDIPYDHNVGLHDNKDYDPRKPNEAEVKTQKLIALFQMTYVGAPMIYYGDETGMWGGDDPDERKPMLWDDMMFENETGHPFGGNRPADMNAFNYDLFAYYKQLIHLRRDHPALSRGTYRPLIRNNEVYGFLRETPGETVAVFINNSPLNQSVDLPELANKRWQNLLETGAVDSQNNRLHITLDARTGAVLLAH